MHGIEIKSYLLVFLYLNMISCGHPADSGNNSAAVRNANPFGYDLSNPDKSIILPPVLIEISGISVIDSTIVACVQDENGIVFIFDITKNEIRDQLIFHFPGDYEGIASVAGSYYVLRSDGTLFETGNDRSSVISEQPGSTVRLPADYEGLCYDRRNHRLLIVPKNNPGRGSEDEKKHPVYALDLQSAKDTLKAVLELDSQSIKDSVKVALEFDLADITRYAAENHIEISDDEKIISLMVSDIGIHPISNMLYAISAVNRMLFVFDEDGTITYIEELKPELFSMPEGISFLDNGDMLISNEGRTNPASILLFRYRTK